jgi:hypothetical protein
MQRDIVNSCGLENETIFPSGCRILDLLSRMPAEFLLYLRSLRPFEKYMGPGLSSKPKDEEGRRISSR